MLCDMHVHVGTGVDSASIIVCFSAFLEIAYNAFIFGLICQINLFIISVWNETVGTLQ